MICFLPTTSLFFHRFRWLTPHFEGNHNIFLSDTILLKTQKFRIFMNMPNIDQSYGRGCRDFMWTCPQCYLEFTPPLCYTLIKAMAEGVEISCGCVQWAIPFVINTPPVRSFKQIFHWGEAF